MENGLDLTLRLGLPSPTVDTHLSLHTATSDQGINVDGGSSSNKNEGGVINGSRERQWGLMEDGEVNVNLRVYKYIFKYFAGVGETLNYTPYPMPPSLAPTPRVSEYVVMDVPARRAQRNNSVAIANAKLRGGGRIEETKKCTNRNCNAITTPMWRRGPLGPKTLCNACGIKFRKEEERRAKRN